MSKNPLQNHKGPSHQALTHRDLHPGISQNQPPPVNQKKRRPQNQRKIPGPSAALSLPPKNRPKHHRHRPEEGMAGKCLPEIQPKKSQISPGQPAARAGDSGDPADRAAMADGRQQQVQRSDGKGRLPFRMISIPSFSFHRLQSTLLCKNCQYFPCNSQTFPVSPFSRNCDKIRQHFHKKGDLPLAEHNFNRRR